MRLRKKLADRKGAAMELAILVIVVSLSMAILILTTSMLQHSQQLHAPERMQQTVELEQISDDFCANTEKSDAELASELKLKFPAYDFTITDGTMVVRATGTPEVLLTVQKTGNTITQWNKK